jgi:hypothetical protein
MTTNTIKHYTIADLADDPRWVAWRYEKKNPDDERPTKVPYLSAKTRASTTKPDWLTLAEARAVSGDGEGPVLGDLYGLWVLGVDLDDCFDGDVVKAWAREIIQRLGTYAEVSPSGSGIKCLMVGDQAHFSRVSALIRGQTSRQWRERNQVKHGPAIEFDISAHYFTITHNVLDGFTKIRLVSVEQLEWLVEFAEATFGSGAILTRLARESRIHPLLQAVMERANSGQYPSRSEAALALMAALKKTGWNYEDAKAACCAFKPTRDWAEEKGLPHDERGLRRCWERAGGPDEGQVFADDSVHDPFDAEPLPPKFDPNLLPGLLRDFVEKRAKAMGVDMGGLAWAALSACSGALDGSTRLEINPYYEVPPGIWVLLIGAPSSGKSPILKAAFDPIKRIQREDMEKYRKVKAAWDAADKATRGDEPICRRLITDNATIEAVQKIEARQTRGLIMFNDEWASLIGMFDKYNSKKGGHVDRAYILRGYDGGDYALDRLSGDRHTPNHHLVIAGGIQPKRLRELGRLDSDGLLQRNPPIGLRRMVAGLDHEGEGSEVVGYEALIRYLVNQPGDQKLTLSPEAKAIWHTIVEKTRMLADDCDESSELGDAFGPFCTKLERVWASVALVLQFAMNYKPGDTATPVVVRETAAKMAAGLLDNLLLHAMQFYSWYNGSGEDSVPLQLCAWLLTTNYTRLRASDITSNFRPCRGMKIDDLRKLLSYHVAWGWLEPEGEINTRAWLVNQTVYSKFAARAVEERERRERVRAVMRAAFEQRSSDVSRAKHDLPAWAQEKENENGTSSPSPFPVPKQEGQENVAKPADKAQPGVSQNGTSEPAARKFQYRPQSYDDWLRRVNQTEDD